MLTSGFPGDLSADSIATGKVATLRSTPTRSEKQDIKGTRSTKQNSLLFLINDLDEQGLLHRLIPSGVRILRMTNCRATNKGYVVPKARIFLPQSPSGDSG